VSRTPLISSAFNRIMVWSAVNHVYELRAFASAASKRIGLRVPGDVQLCGSHAGQPGLSFQPNR